MLDVAHKRCDQCLFGPNKIVSDKRRAQVLREVARDRSYFVCHKGSMRDQELVCAGFAEAEARGEFDCQLLRIARRLNAVQMVDAETGKPVEEKAK